MNRRNGFIAVFVLVLSMGACGRGERDVEGTVERIGDLDGTATTAERRYIKLEGDGSIYTCRVIENPACAILVEDDVVSMTVAPDRASSVLDIDVQ